MRSGLRGGVGACALAALVCASLPAQARAPSRARPARTAVAPGFAFTPAAADPRLAAAFARSGLGSANFSDGAFRFTPSGGSSRRAITVAVRSRASTRANGAAVTPASAAAEIAPSAFSLGMSVGWRRFAISGDVARSYGGFLPDARESADLGLSFMGKRWSTKLDLAADRPIGDRAPLIGADQSWSLGLGGSYALTRNLALSGGVRYKTQRDELNTLVTDDRRDSQAVYLGTTFRF